MLMIQTATGHASARYSIEGACKKKPDTKRENLAF